jgi:hypothetical protein
MSADDRREPDIASLFAPVTVAETFGGVLIEARDVLDQLDDPVDAELWGSDLIGALSSSTAGQASLTDALTGSLVPAAEAACTPEALALLCVFAAVGSPALRAAPTAWPTPAGPGRWASRRSVTAGTTPTSADVRSR